MGGGWWFGISMEGKGERGGGGGGGVGGAKRRCLEKQL